MPYDPKWRDDFIKEAGTLKSIFGKKVLPKVETVVHTVGMVILILLILAITANDIKNLIQAGGVSGYIEFVLK